MPRASRISEAVHASTDLSTVARSRPYALLKGTTDINHAPEYAEEKLVKHFYSIAVDLFMDDDPRLFAGISHQEGSDWTAEDKRRPNWFLDGSAQEVLGLDVKGVLASLDQEEVRGSVNFFGNTTVGYNRCDAHTKLNTDWVFRRTKLR
jgi:hypothetical protein